MITVAAIRERLSKEKEALHSYKVAELWLFGSAAREESEAEDLDFLVEFSGTPGLDDFMGLKFFLEDIFGSPIDLHSRSACPDRFYRRIASELKHVA